MFDWLQKKAFDTLAQSTLQQFKADYSSKHNVTENSFQKRVVTSKRANRNRFIRRFGRFKPTAESQ